MNPYGRSPYEVIIAPLTHEENVMRADDVAVAEVSLILRELSGVFRKGLGIGSYNMWLHTTPKEAEDFHWHIVVSPLTSKWGGVEKGYGMYVVPIDPGDAAASLRTLLGR